MSMERVGKMPLKLQDYSGAQTSFNAGVSIDRMSWWFWIKAGIGFTVGAVIAVALLYVPMFLLYLVFLAGLFGGLFSHR
jgi:hypothetical protein